MVQNQLAVMVELTAFHIIRGVFFHLLTPDLRESEKIKLLIPLLFTGSNVAAPARTGEPQKTTNFARQVADPPGENGSDMQLIYMV